MTSVYPKRKADVFEYLNIRLDIAKLRTFS